MASRRPVSSKKTAAAAPEIASVPTTVLVLPEAVPAAEIASDTPAADMPPKSTRLWHDLFFKEFFGFLACAESLMREVLPAPFIQAIEWAKMTMEPTVIINGNPKEKRVDLLFRAPLKYEVNNAKDECCCFLHLEGQSTYDRHMGRRIFAYHSALWEKFERENPGKPPPVIFPVVIYNGKTPWKGETNIEHTVGDDLPPNLRAVAEPYIPKLKFILLDVVRMEEEKLSGKGWHNIGLDMLRIARTGDFAGFIRRHSKEITEMEAEGGKEAEVLKTVARYFALLETEGDKKKVEEVREKINLLPEDEKGPTMTLFEIFYGERLKKDLQQGLERGIEQGIEQGIERGIGIGVERGVERGRGIGREEGELIGEIMAYQRIAGRRIASKQELNGKPIPELKKLLTQVRRECLAVVR